MSTDGQPMVVERSDVPSARPNTFRLLSIRQMNQIYVVTFNIMWFLPIHWDATNRYGH